ncbi:MAG: hypothetical protein ACQEWV_10465 [Bacillota bacterium]
MSSLLEKKLGLNYAILNENQNGKNKIRVFKKLKKDISQDVFIELQNNYESNAYNLILNQRGKEFNKAQFNDKDESICALGIYAESVLGDRTRDIETQNKILDLENNNIPILNNLLSTKVGDDYFSIFKEKKMAINLEKVNNSIYNIYYLSPDLKKIFLIKDRESPSAFLVLYNFSQKLKQFSEIYNKWEKDIVLDLQTEEKIRRLFLGK